MQKIAKMLRKSSSLLEGSEPNNSQRTEPAEQTSKIEYDALNLNKRSIEKVKNFGGSVKIGDSPPHLRRPPEVAHRIE